MKVDFEDIEKKTTQAINSKAYLDLVEVTKNAKKIFLIGNGGLHFVAGHMSTDISRLVSDKSCYSFDSFGFITSNANDHGHENVFQKWLECTASVENPDDCLVIGMSCSGNSINIINALDWAKEKSFSTYLISGQKSEKLDKSISELSFECEYFHTVEVMTMMIFYDLIHQIGHRCPSIKGEKTRLVKSPLRGN